MDSPFSVDATFHELEYADPVTRLGLLVGGVNPDDDTYRGLTLTDDGRLRVDAEITLSSVSLAVDLDVLDGDRVGIYGYESGDPLSPVPINVTSDGHVRTVSSLNGDMLLQYNEGTYLGGIEQILISYSTPALQTFNMVTIEATGRSDAVFRLKKNSVTIAMKRNNWCERNVTFHYQYGFTLQAGDILSLTIEHNELTSIPFSATIYGEEP